MMTMAQEAQRKPNLIRKQMADRPAKRNSPGQRGRGVPQRPPTMGEEASQMGKLGFNTQDKHGNWGKSDGGQWRTPYDNRGTATSSQKFSGDPWMQGVGFWKQYERKNNPGQSHGAYGWDQAIENYGAPPSWMTSRQEQEEWMRFQHWNKRQQQRQVYDLARARG